MMTSDARSAVAQIDATLMVALVFSSKRRVKFRSAPARFYFIIKAVGMFAGLGLLGLLVSAMVSQNDHVPEAWVLLLFFLLAGGLCASLTEWFFDDLRHLSRTSRK